MGHPCAVVAVVCFSLFIGAHLGKSFFVRLRVVFDRNLRGHSAHRESGSPMARLNAEQGVRMHEMRGHGDQGAVGQQEIALVPEPFNTREDVVPAAAVEPGRMVAYGMPSSSCANLKTSFQMRASRWLSILGR